MADFQPLLSETFVIRLWREALSGMWRGRIVHVSDRATAHFVTLDQALAFISRFADGLEAQTGSMDEATPDSKPADQAEQRSSGQQLNTQP